MSWNYRIFKQDTPQAADGKYILFIGECYYDEDGVPEMHSTLEHNHITGDDEEELKEVYTMVGEAFKAPIVELDESGDFKHETN